MREKREVSGFVPYRKRGDEREFFLQMRSPNAKTSPNLFGVFGGGLEVGETFERALFREIEEELAYVPRTPIYFSRFENANRISSLFIEEVGSDFESLVDVREGEYGKFLTASEVLKSNDVTFMVRLIIFQLNGYLSRAPTGSV
jgi:8-oxo-dGTP pyrophosphatase MutT (NUDIX family)